MHSNRVNSPFWHFSRQKVISLFHFARAPQQIDVSSPRRTPIWPSPGRPGGRDPFTRSTASRRPGRSCSPGTPSPRGSTGTTHGAIASGRSSAPGSGGGLRRFALHAVRRAGLHGAGYIDPNFDRSHFAQGGTLLQLQAGRIGNEVRYAEPRHHRPGVRRQRPPPWCDPGSDRSVPARLDRCGARGEADRAHRDLAGAQRHRRLAAVAAAEDRPVQRSREGRRRRTLRRQLADHRGRHGARVVRADAHATTTCTRTRPGRRSSRSGWPRPSTAWRSSPGHPH